MWAVANAQIFAHNASNPPHKQFSPGEVLVTILLYTAACLAVPALILLWPVLFGVEEDWARWWTWPVSLLILFPQVAFFNDWWDKRKVAKFYQYLEDHDMTEAEFYGYSEEDYPYR